MNLNDRFILSTQIFHRNELKIEDLIILQRDKYSVYKVYEPSNFYNWSMWPVKSRLRVFAPMGAEVVISVQGCLLMFHFIFTLAPAAD